MSENSINNVLNRLSKMQEDPQYLTHFGHPVNIENIIHFEKRFGVILPQSYKKFLLQSNGGMMLHTLRNEIRENHVDYEMYKGESVYFFSIEELTKSYSDLKDREWKVSIETANPYPVIPFCSLPNNELLVFIHGEKSGNESPVFDAYHEEFPSTWGILAPDFTTFLSDYLDALGNPKIIGNEDVGVASDYFDDAEEIKETAEEILARTEIEILERPDYDFPYFERASVFKDKKYYSDALLAINKAIELKTKDAFYHYMRGDILIEVEQYRAALIEFDIAVKLTPENAFYLCCRADTLFKLNKIKPAFDDCNHAIDLDPSYVLPYMTRQEIYLFMGMEDKAELDQLIIDKLNDKND